MEPWGADNRRRGNVYGPDRETVHAGRNPAADAGDEEEAEEGGDDDDTWMDVGDDGHTVVDEDAWVTANEVGRSREDRGRETVVDRHDRVMAPGTDDVGEADVGEASAGARATAAEHVVAARASEEPGRERMTGEGTKNWWTFQSRGCWPNVEPD